MKLIQTTDYLLLIDEEAETKPNKYALNIASKEVYKTSYPYRNLDKITGARLVLAYYPLTKEAEELDLPLLPNLFKEEDVEKLAIKSADYNFESGNSQWINGFIDGYKTAQSKQFSLEDMKKAIEMAQTPIETGIGDYYPNIPEIIQSLSTQQLPVSFEPEYDIVHTDHAPNGFERLLKLKTNSEGKEEIQGTYKY